MYLQAILGAPIRTGIVPPSRVGSIILDPLGQETQPDSGLGLSPPYVGITISDPLAQSIGQETLPDSSDSSQQNLYREKLFDSSYLD